MINYMRRVAICLVVLVSFCGCAPAIINAVKQNDLPEVKRLLDQGEDIEAKDIASQTALYTAAYLGNTKMVVFLLSRGADPSVVNSGGYTPSRAAAYFGHSEVAMLLKKAEAGEKVESILSSITPRKQIVVSDVDTLPPAASMAKRKQGYAVVIGIEQYRQQLPKADFSAHDAQIVSEYLTKVLGYPEENVIVRINDKAAKTDMEKYLEEWLPSRVKPDDSVFVYYSGHGAPNPRSGDPYLVPYDGDPAFVESTTYPLKRLYAALDKLPAKEVVVMLDSCFSGAGGRSVIAKGIRPMMLSIENPVLASSKTMVLAASSGSQVSSTFQEKTHGLLTYFFLKGLQGEGDINKDGTIELAEIYEYIRPNVERIARNQYNNEQTPQLLANPEALKKGGRLVERSAP